MQKCTQHTVVKGVLKIEKYFYLYYKSVSIHSHMNDLAHIQKSEGWLSPSFVSLYSLNSNKYRISGSGRAQSWDL